MRSSSQSRSRVAWLVKKSPAGSPSRGITVLTLEGRGDHTIDVKQGSDGQILVRHSRFDPIEFGVLRDLEVTANAFARNGSGPDDVDVVDALNNLNRVCGGRLELKGREPRLTQADAALIRQCIRQLE